MKTYKLVTKTSKETINKVQMDNLGGAIDYFAKIKKLTTTMLLSIYDITT